DAHRADRTAGLVSRHQHAPLSDALLAHGERRHAAAHELRVVTPMRLRAQAERGEVRRLTLVCFSNRNHWITNRVIPNEVRDLCQAARKVPRCARDDTSFGLNAAILEDI